VAAAFHYDAGIGINDEPTQAQKSSRFSPQFCIICIAGQAIPSAVRQLPAGGQVKRDALLAIVDLRIASSKNDCYIDPEEMCPMHLNMHLGWLNATGRSQPGFASIKYDIETRKRIKAENSQHIMDLKAREPPQHSGCCVIL
jgi:hypothetical protein